MIYIRTGEVGLLHMSVRMNYMDECFWFELLFWIWMQYKTSYFQNDSKLKYVPIYNLYMYLHVCLTEIMSKHKCSKKKNLYQEYQTYFNLWELCL